MSTDDELPGGWAASDLTDGAADTEEWVRERFGDVGPAPDNVVTVDPNAEPSPNIERPCEGEVSDDD